MSQAELDVYEAERPYPAEHAAPMTVNLFGAHDPQEVVARASEVATALTDVIKTRGLYVDIHGKSYVQVEAWTLLGSMMGVFPVVVWTRKMSDPEGWEARVEARTLAGAVVGAAEAECLRSEKRWGAADDYAVRSMAQTRATSKALRGPLGFIVHLAGFSATPADEMPDDGKPAQETAATVNPVTKKQHGRIGALITDIADASNQDKDKVRDDSRAWCKERYGVTTRADLTEVQADELIAYLEGILELAQAPVG